MRISRAPAKDSLPKYSFNMLRITHPSAPARPLAPALPIPRSSFHSSARSNQAPPSNQERPWLSEAAPANEGWMQWGLRKAKDMLFSLPKNKGPWVHRADNRSFEEVIDKQGLVAKGGHTSFREYVETNAASKYIGAFADHEDAMRMASGLQRNVFHIHPGDGKQRIGESANAKYAEETGNDNDWGSRENEHVFTDRIPLHLIHSYTDPKGRHYLNPHYVPPEQRPPRQE